MAQAECLNDDCEKTTWRLTKHPADYSGGGVSCPTCGTTRTEVHFEDGESEQQSRDHRQPQARGQQQSRGQQGGQAPARQRQQGGGGGAPVARGEPESAGDALAQGALALTSDEASTVEQAEAFKGIGGVVLEGISRFTKYQQQVNQKQEEHAKNVDLQEATDKPQCKCGYVFSRIPRGKERVTCPECSMEYRVVDD